MTVPPTAPGAEPAPREEAARAAVVTASWAAVRAQPDHRSELVSQWVNGEPLRVLERSGDGWCRTRGPDGYEGWTCEGAVAATSGGEARRWTSAARARSLGTGVRPLAEPAGEDDRSDREPHPGWLALPRWLPWGSRVVAVGDGTLRLAGDLRVRPERPERVASEEERGRRFPARGEAVVATAADWIGVPYLWGGRTRGGADCSGFVQSVYAVHGVALPRDSVDQLASGAEVREALGTPSVREPGDLLFFGGGEEGEEARRVTHVALSLGGTEILHAADANGAVARDDLAGQGPAVDRLRERLLAVVRPLRPR